MSVSRERAVSRVGRYSDETVRGAATHKDVLAHDEAIRIDAEGDRCERDCSHRCARASTDFLTCEIECRGRRVIRALLEGGPLRRSLARKAERADDLLTGVRIPNRGKV